MTPPMLSKLRPRSVYDVMAAVACLGVLAGGTAYAAATITGADVRDDSLTGADIRGHAATDSAPEEDGSLATYDIKNGALQAVDLANEAVGSAQIANQSITHSDLAAASVGSGKVIDNSLTGADVRDDSLTGADIDESTLSGGAISGVKISGLIHVWDFRSNTDSSSPKRVVATCPRGTFALGSGYMIRGGTPGDGTAKIAVQTVRLTTFEVFVEAYETTPTDEDWDVQAIASCANAE